MTGWFVPDYAVYALGVKGLGANHSMAQASRWVSSFAASSRRAVSDAGDARRVAKAGLATGGIEGAFWT